MKEVISAEFLQQGKTKSVTTVPGLTYRNHKGVQIKRLGGVHTQAPGDGIMSFKKI